MAKAKAQGSTALWDFVEIEFKGPSARNPFAEVKFGATFKLGAREVKVPGFYDGNGVYKVRFMPDRTGDWTYTTYATVSALAGKTGSVTATDAAPGVHGPVQAVEFGFAYADGTPYIPVGTTAYAWVHQPKEVRDRTIATLAAGPFTKIRMCVFPKHYTYNTNEPDSFVFPGTLEQGFDHSRFDPEFFALFESELDRLLDLGIEADLILFHPYDRWGFQDLPVDVEDRYLRYVVARFASFRNVWWAMANEWDFMAKKTVQDFHRYFRIVQEEDPYAHLRSVHNGLRIYDHALPWVTHASMQRSDTDRCHEWRTQYGKPVVIDECCYEGNISEGWGNISGRELMRRQWTAVISGGWPAAHAETLYNDRHEFWWSKGGDLTGESPARIAFLRRILEEAPIHRLEVVRPKWPPCHLAAGDDYRLYYMGLERALWREIELPAGGAYHVDVIDTWGMTVTTVPGTHAGRLRIDLPGREYIAIRVRKTAYRERSNSRISALTSARRMTLVLQQVV